MKNVYFIGIGGIGMSAIARYFKHEGYAVAGYDRFRSPLCEALEHEGIEIHYTDDVELIGAQYRQNSDTLVVYTPAVHDDHSELKYFRDNGFEVLKRSQVLGHLSEGKFVMAVAGTHGKTTTTTLTAWINHIAGGGGSAFLGGISKNFGSNLVLGSGERFAVEADEFDRSFLQLHPDIAIVTAADADHLDIYGTHECLRQAFTQFVRQIKPGGALIIKEGVDIEIDNSEITVYRYSATGDTDFHAENLRLGEDGRYTFDMACPNGRIDDCRLGVVGRINVENAVAAIAMCHIAGIEETGLKQALSSFSGVKRRFECYINTPQLVYIDDYAHHPEELRAAITSIKEIFPHRKLTVIFQPHLYTRTRDFYRQFAEVLSLADEVILIPIYPAREEPIEGITSRTIANLVTVPKRIITKERIAQEIEQSAVDVVVTFGAGDIDAYCNAIAAGLHNKIDKK